MTARAIEKLGENYKRNKFIMVIVHRKRTLELLDPLDLYL